MSRSVSATALSAMLAPETDEVFLILLEIDEATLAQPMRFVHDHQDVTSRGNDYVAAFFDIELPTERPDSIDSARLTVDNVDRQIVQAVRLAQGRPSVRIEIVLASDPDTVEAGPFDFELQAVDYDAQSVSGTLAFDDVVEVRGPLHAVTPWHYPDLF